MADDPLANKPKIAPAVLKASKLARKKADEMLSCLDESGADSIASFLGSKHSLLLSLDRTWKVEEGFFIGMSGKAGADCLQKAILETLPTAEVGKTSGE